MRPPATWFNGMIRSRNPSGEIAWGLMVLGAAEANVFLLLSPPPPLPRAVNRVRCGSMASASASHDGRCPASTFAPSAPTRRICVADERAIWSAGTLWGWHQGRRRWRASPSDPFDDGRAATASQCMGGLEGCLQRQRRRGARIFLNGDAGRCELSCGNSVTACRWAARGVTHQGVFRPSRGVGNGGGVGGRWGRSGP